MPTGALSAPPPTPVPVQVTGVVALGLIVPPAGLEADVLFNEGKMPTTSAIIKVAAMNRRNETRVLHGHRVRFANLVIVGIISSTPAQWRCKAAGAVQRRRICRLELAPFTTGEKLHSSHGFKLKT